MAKAVRVVPPGTHNDATRSSGNWRASTADCAIVEPARWIEKDRPIEVDAKLSHQGGGAGYAGILATLKKLQIGAVPVTEKLSSPVAGQ